MLTCFSTCSSLSFSLCVCECLCMCAFTLFKHDSHCLLSLLQLTCCRCRCLCRCQHSALTSLHCFSVEQGDHDAASVVVALAVVLLLPLLLCFLLLFCVLCHHLAVSCQRRLERVNCYFAAPTLQVHSLGWISLPSTPALYSLPAAVFTSLQLTATSPRWGAAHCLTWSLVNVLCRSVKRS